MAIVNFLSRNVSVGIQRRKLPDNPSAWLFRAAKNNLIGEFRNRNRRERLLEENATELIKSFGTAEGHAEVLTTFATEMNDGLLRMLFVCCDENIPIESQIASSLNTSIDGAGFAFPAPHRWLMKRKFLTKPLPAGFKMSKHLIADESLSVEAALDELRAAITRQDTESERAIHPGFGKIIKEEHAAFHLRHAEMHMSFVVPSGCWFGLSIPRVIALRLSSFALPDAKMYPH